MLIELIVFDINNKVMKTRKLRDVDRFVVKSSELVCVADNIVDDNVDVVVDLVVDNVDEAVARFRAIIEFVSRCEIENSSRSHNDLLKRKLHFLKTITYHFHLFL